MRRVVRPAPLPSLATHVEAVIASVLVCALLPVMGEPDGEVCVGRSLAGLPAAHSGVPVTGRGPIVTVRLGPCTDRDLPAELCTASSVALNGARVDWAELGGELAAIRAADRIVRERGGRPATAMWIGAAADVPAARVAEAARIGAEAGFEVGLLVLADP